MKILDIKINKVTSDSKVIARAIVYFDDCIVKGFKVFRDEEKNKDFVTTPSYFGGNGWIPLVRTHNKSDWDELCSQILEAYNKTLIEESLLEDK